jgi:hypothetical protein
LQRDLAHIFVGTLSRRDLKHVYFTVLTHFSEEELCAQLQALRQLEAESATHMEKVRAAERVNRRRVASAQHAKKHPVQNVSRSEPDGVPDSASAAEQTGSTVFAAEPAVVGTDCAATPALAPGDMPSKQRRRTLRKQIERIEAYLHQRSLVSPQPEGREVAAGQAAEATVTVEFNPKTRGGWGFWKS